MAVTEYAASLLRDTCIAGLVAIFILYIRLVVKGKGPSPETVTKFQGEGNDDYPSLNIPDDILPYLGVPGSKEIDIRSLCTCEKFDDIYPYLPFDIENYDPTNENSLDYDIFYRKDIIINLGL